MELRNRRQTNWSECADCERRVRRLYGDKFLKCHHCGWTIGYPVIRWLTHPTWLLYCGEHLGHRLPSIGRSAKVGSILVLGGVLAGLLFGVFAPVGVSITDMSETGAANASPNDPAVQQGYNRTEVERHFIQFLNEERHSRGLQSVSQRNVLTQMGQKHSRNMANHDYIGHEEPDGDSIVDRYRRHGLLPECRLPIKGSNRTYRGAENVAGWNIDTAVRAGWADRGTYFASNEIELAWALFQQWMHSPPHRKAMLVASADEAGLGLHITDNGNVYASLELC